MARVPTAEQTVFPGSFPTPSANAADFGAAIGDQYRYAAGQVEQGANDLAAIALKRQQLTNEALAQDTDVKFQTELGALENQYYSLQGQAAAEGYPKFQADVTALRAKYMGTAPNDAVKNMIGSSVAYSVNRSLFSAGRYAGTETRQWAADSAAGRIELLKQQIATHFTDQAFVDNANKAIRSTAQRLGDASGWSPEHVQAWTDAQIAAAEADRQKAMETQAMSMPVSDRIAALVGGAGPTAGVGGANYKGRLIAMESGGDPNAGAGKAHSGLVGADDAWWDRFGGGGDRNSLADNQKALDRETAVNLPALKEALGRNPSDGELYLAHQQGLAGAIALLKADPSKPASEVVPVENIAGNIRAPMDPKTITAGAFVGAWTAPFAGSDTPTVGAPPNVAGNPVSDLFAGMDDATRQRVTKASLAEWNTQAAAARAETNFQQQQDDRAQKLALQQSEDGWKQKMIDNAVDPSKPAPSLLEMSQDPVLRAHPDAISSLLSFSANINKAGGSAGQSARITQDVIRRMSPAYDGADKITDPGQLTAIFAPPDGSLSAWNRQDYEWALKQFQQGQTPEGQAIQKATDSFFKQSGPFLKSILKDYDTMHPAASDRALDLYGYRQDIDRQVQAKLAAGKDWRVLFDPSPGNQEYVGRPAYATMFFKTYEEQLNQYAPAQPDVSRETPATSPSVPVGGMDLSKYGTDLDALNKAVKNGDVPYSDAVEYARKMKLVQ